MVWQAGWCGKVLLALLIKEHTQNECNSKFNLLKAHMRSINIFTEKGLDTAYQKGIIYDIALHQLPARTPHGMGTKRV